MCPGRPSGGGAFTKLGDFAEFGEASAFHALLLGGVTPNDLEQPPVMPLSNTMHYSARPSLHLQPHIRQNFDSQCWKLHQAGAEFPETKVFSHQICGEWSTGILLRRFGRNTRPTWARITTSLKTIEYKTRIGCGRIWRYRLPSTICVCTVGTSLRNYRQMQNNKRGHLLCKEKRDGRLEPKHFNELHQSSPIR